MNIRVCSHVRPWIQSSAEVTCPPWEAEGNMRSPDTEKPQFGSGLLYKQAAFKLTWDILFYPSDSATVYSSTNKAKAWDRAQAYNYSYYAFVVSLTLLWFALFPKKWSRVALCTGLVPCPAGNMHKTCLGGKSLGRRVTACCKHLSSRSENRPLLIFSTGTTQMLHPFSELYREPVLP